MQIVLEWMFRHPILVLVGGIAAFVVWLAAPVTWRNGEGSIVEDGENIRDWYGGFSALTGNLWFILLGKSGRR